MKVALLLVGFGNVARHFVRLLDESKAVLRNLDIEPRVIGIATRRHGGLYDETGLDAVQAASEQERGGMFAPLDTPSSLEFIQRLRSQDAEARVLIETTTLDVRSGEPATSHVRAAFAAGAHVITANKGPIAFGYRHLANEAARTNVEFLFEGAVMDGIPVFNLVRETMPAASIRGFRGVINATTNFMLTAMEQGRSYADALAEMQARGITEADPSLDVDGWDAAAKTAALANVFLDAGTTPLDVPRESLDAGTAARARAARKAGKRLKVVGRGRRTADAVETAVALEELDADDPLAILEGQANALELDTWPVGRVVITQRDGDLEKTAYALVSDLVTLTRRLKGRAT
jgi:homoserine dehydrogenase